MLKARGFRTKKTSHPTGIRSQVSDARRMIARTSTRSKVRAPARARAKERGRTKKEGRIKARAKEDRPT